jgi:hypothetical protein
MQTNTLPMLYGSSESTQGRSHRLLRILFSASFRLFFRHSHGDEFHIARNPKCLGLILYNRELIENFVKFLRF